MQHSLKAVGFSAPQWWGRAHGSLCSVIHPIGLKQTLDQFLWFNKTRATRKNELVYKKAPNIFPLKIKSNFGFFL